MAEPAAICTQARSDATVASAATVERWSALAGGALIGGLWCLHLIAIDVPNKIRGDAAEYLEIALTFSDFGDALTFAGGRSMGFPLVVYSLLRLHLVMHAGALFELALFLREAAALLFAFHVTSVLAFYAALSSWRESGGRALHWGLGVLLLCHPGLVGHTTVLLTDTFAVDLSMLAIALLALSQRARRCSLALATLAGLTFAAAALCRPTYVAALLVAFILTAAITSQVPRARTELLRLLTCSLACVGLLAIATLPCKARYGKPCLADPTIVPRLVPPSLRVGLDSPRAYWSAWSSPKERNPDCADCVALRDPTLTATWARHCTIDPKRFAFGVPACFALRPDLGALFAFKKSIGLLDSYHYQDYAVDLTPRWARLWTRPFGALAFAGLFAAAWLLLRARVHHLGLAPTLLCTLVLVQTILLSLGHIEGRYGYALVPGALFALFTLMGSLASSPRRSRMVAAATLSAAAAVFLAQTAAWDAHDPVLQRIERSLSGDRKPRLGVRSDVRTLNSAHESL